MRKIIISTILVIAGMMLGWACNDLFEIMQYQKEYNGFWISNMNKTEAEEYVENQDKGGRWICINIRGMDYDKLTETCKHEAGHEIYARKCQENISKCIN